MNHRLMAIFLIAIAVASAHAAVTSGTRVHGHGFLAANMQPEAVARILTQVEDEWQEQVVLFSRCNVSAGSDSASVCDSATKAFEKSCSVIAQAILRGSNGDRSVAKEYMADVCAQDILSAWHREHCRLFAAAVGDSMTADTYTNRVELDGSGLCQGFWLRFTAKETQRAANELAFGGATETKNTAVGEAAVADETKARETEEAAGTGKTAVGEKAKQLGDEEAAEAARTAEDEKAKELEDEEVNQKAAEAQSKAEEVTLRLEATKARAEAEVQAAEQKAAEARIASSTSTQTVAPASVEEGTAAAANAVPAAAVATATSSAVPTAAIANATSSGETGVADTATEQASRK